ncbi:MAG: hypothetical protein HQL15_04885 [Candidatus Omnitrophica bacterium]|nr:hypothetical protein [Candidatus Omnitrophota bacterium]
MHLIEFIKNNRWTVLFFVVLTIFRVSLIGQGHRFDLDEDRYLNALYFWIEVAQGNFSHMSAYLFNAAARPGFILVSLIPAGVQILLLKLKMISILDLHFFDIPSFFNVLVTVANSFLFLRIAMALVSDYKIALSATIAYSLLVNTNLYIRHLFPYDYALLFFFMALWIILKGLKNQQWKFLAAAICGVFSALGGLIYPGYFALSLVMTIFLAVSAQSQWLLTLIYCLFFSATIMVFEGMSQACGVSYLRQLFILSHTVDHGSFSEGFLFLMRYLRDVEGLVGGVSFLLFAIYCCYFAFKDTIKFKWLLIAVVSLFSFNAVMGLVFHQMVFYGRTLHMYFPFLVLATARTLSLVSNLKWRDYLTKGLVVCSIVSFVPFAYTYLQLSYPGDIFFKYVARVPQGKILWFAPPMQGNLDIHPEQYSAVLSNFESYDNITDAPESLPSNMVLTVSKPHPLNFPAYTFENFSPQERAMIKSKHYQMQLYLSPDSIDQVDHSLHVAFNPRLPFVYTRNWVGEYMGDR